MACRQNIRNLEEHLKAVQEQLDHEKWKNELLVKERDQWARVAHREAADASKGGQA
jgi:hypothetical protein